MKIFCSKYLIFFIGLALLISCKKETQKTANNFSAFLGGTLNDTLYQHVFLLKNDKIIDTLPINNGVFGKKFDLLNAGLYALKINKDVYTVFIDKNDSLNIHLNKHPFQSTISFTGKGSEKNVFLKQLEDTLKMDCNFIYQKKLTAFKTSVDSIRDNRRAYYLRKKTELGWGKDFDTYPQALIDYTYFSYLEQFTLLSKDSLPDDYFSFRNKTDLNKNDLIYFNSYKSYFISFLDVQAKKSAFKNIEEKEIFKLNILDSISKNESIKNYVSAKMMYDFFVGNPKNNLNEKLVNTFKRINTDTEQKKNIESVQIQIDRLKKTQQLPQINLKTSDGNTVTSFKNSAPSIIFFWSVHNMPFYNKMMMYIKENTHKKIHYYAINIDNTSNWKKYISTNDINVTYLQTTNFNEVADKWAVFNLNRFILLHPNGNIKDAFYHL